jgi:hypothetical protein
LVDLGTWGFYAPTVTYNNDKNRARTQQAPAHQAKDTDYAN